jgi:hypothetical protein
MQWLVSWDCGLCEGPHCNLGCVLLPGLLVLRTADPRAEGLGSRGRVAVANHHGIHGLALKNLCALK